MKSSTDFIQELSSQSYLPYYNKEARPTLEEAIFNEIQRNNGAVWYGNFVEPLTNYLAEQFNSGAFLPYSYSRKYRKEIPEEEFNRDLHMRMKDIAVTQLKQLSAKQPESFNIHSGYELLRERFEIEKNDRMEFAYPLVTFDQLPDLLDKIEFLGGKRIGEFWGDKIICEYMGDITETERLRREIPVICEDLKNEGGSGYAKLKAERMVKEIVPKYLKTIGNTRVAYTDFDSAMRMISPYFSFNAKEGRNVIVPLKV